MLEKSMLTFSPPPLNMFVGGGVNMFVGGICLPYSISLLIDVGKHTHQAVNMW